MSKFAPLHHIHGTAVLRSAPEPKNAADCGPMLTAMACWSPEGLQLKQERIEPQRAGNKLGNRTNKEENSGRQRVCEAGLPQ